MAEHVSAMASAPEIDAAAGLMMGAAGGVPAVSFPPVEQAIPPEQLELRAMMQAAQSCGMDPSQVLAAMHMLPVMPQHAATAQVMPHAQAPMAIPAGMAHATTMPMTGVPGVLAAHNLQQVQPMLQGAPLQLMQHHQMMGMPQQMHLPYELHAAIGGLAGLVQPTEEAPIGAPDPGTGEYTCTVCRKVFKRAANLIYHMTEHRPQADVQQVAADFGSAEGSGLASGSVKCTDCDKEFATKYQAKKHFLRRHFAGEKPFACTKCGKKRFVVKEDLTMHMKACGNVFVCKCGIRLCSLGALKRHCKQFNHEPESFEPTPESSITHAIPNQAAIAHAPQSWQHDALIATQPLPSSQPMPTSAMVAPVQPPQPSALSAMMAEQHAAATANAQLITHPGAHPGAHPGSQGMPAGAALNGHLYEEQQLEQHPSAFASASAMPSGLSGAQHLQTLALQSMAANAVVPPPSEWPPAMPTE